MREPEPADRREFYATMNSELSRLDRLINQLLEVGRLDAIGHQAEPETVRIDELLTQCAQAAALQHKQEFSQVFRLNVAPLELVSRRLVLEMIFGNLMDNAVKYGGRPPLVTVEAFSRGRDRIVVRVSDNGAGVPTEDRRRIFQLFVRGRDELQRTKQGTGLGLYIVRTLVSMLKGRIAVIDNTGGTGSVFEVALPGRRPPATAIEEVARPATSARRVSELALSGQDTVP
jgi:signal transduction histidine kinase